MRKLLLLIALFPVICLGCSQEQVQEPRPKKLVVWHWMTDREKAFEELAQKYKEDTGIEVEFELYAPSDAYSEKVKGAAQTQNLPDIYSILADKRAVSSFINAGHVLNLSPFMQADDNAWLDSFFKNAVTVNEFMPGNEFNVEPGIYGVPIDMMNIQMLYNKDLFKQAGLDPENPPRSWTGFLEAGKKLKAAGIQGMVSGWGEIWMIDCLLSNYAYNIMGEEKFIKTIKGEVSYADPDWIKVFSVFKEMKDNNLLANGIVIMVNKQAEQMFANQRAAFAFNGSWCVNVYSGMNPGLDYGVMLPPAYSSKYPMKIWGGPGSSFMVNARSARKEDAVTFLKWLTAKDQQAYLAQKTKNLPANKESAVDLSPVLRQFANGSDSATHLNSLPVSELSRVIEARDKGVQSIIIGEKTPEEIALAVQEIKVKEMQKLR